MSDFFVNGIYYVVMFITAVICLVALVFLYKLPGMTVRYFRKRKAQS